MHIEHRKRRVPRRIETDRLVLRCYEPDDAEALRVICADNREHLLRWLPWAEADPQTNEEKLELILSFRSLYDSGANSVMGIFHKDTGELIGGTGLHPCGKLDQLVTRECGYWIAANHSGHGYVTEAVNALTVVAFELLRLKTVVIRCEEGNDRSRAIPERLGYVCEGFMRNVLPRNDEERAGAHRYSMTSTEYEDSESAKNWRADADSIKASDVLDRPYDLRAELECSGTPNRRAHGEGASLKG